MVVFPQNLQLRSRRVSQLYRRTRTWFGLHQKKKKIFLHSSTYFSYSFVNPPLAVLNSRWLKMSFVQVLILVFIRKCTSNGSFFGYISVNRLFAFLCISLHQFRIVGDWSMCAHIGLPQRYLRIKIVVLSVLPKSSTMF